MASITLPVRGGGGERRQRGIALPGTAADVPQAQLASDPGVRVPQGAFDSGSAGMAEAGQALSEIAGRMQTRDDVVSNAIGESAYSESVQSELLRLKTEADLADPETVKGYANFLTQQRDTILSNYKGSANGRASLQSRLEQLRSHAAMTGGMESAQAGQKRVETLVGNDINSLVAQASQDPSKLPELFKTFDQRMETLAPALTQEGQISLTSVAQRQMVLAGVNHYLERGNAAEARNVLETVPNAVRLLSPEQQQQMNSSFAAIEQASTKGVREAQSWLSAFRFVNQREPTAAERLSHSTGQAEGQASPVGKLMADRDSYARQFGPNSPQVRAFDTAIAREGRGANNNLSEESTFRGQYIMASRDFTSTREAFSRIAASADNPTPAGDLSLIIGFAKLNDPGGVVRDQDFVQVASSGGYGEQVKVAVQQLTTGNKLTPALRTDLLKQSKGLMNAALKNQLSLEAQYKQIAKRSGFAEDNVLDLVGEYRSAVQSGPAEPKPGDVVDGYRFKGGSPGAPESWEQVK